MANKFRTLIATAAAGGIAAVGMVVGAQPANADATSCLDWLSRGAVHQPATVLMTTKGTLPVTTAAPRSSLCAGMSVSIGISRTNGHDFRNKNATRDRWEGDAYYYYVKFPLTVDDYGTSYVSRIATFANDFTYLGKVG